MIYDAADHDVVLFGGYNGQYLGDTWTWDGSTWTQLSTTSSPGRVTAGWQMTDDDATGQAESSTRRPIGASAPESATRSRHRRAPRSPR
jgi:hypothetical protein